MTKQFIILTFLSILMLIMMYYVTGMFLLFERKTLSYFRFKLLILNASPQEKEVYKSIYNIINNTDASEYLIKFSLLNPIEIYYIKIKNVKFYFLYDEYDNEYITHEINVYDDDGTIVILIPVDIDDTIVNSLGKFAIGKYEKYQEENEKIANEKYVKEKTKIYKNNINKVNKILNNKDEQDK